MKRASWWFGLLAAVLVLGACSSSRTPRDYKQVISRFFLEVPGNDGTPVQLPLSGVGVIVNPKPVLTEGDVVTVELVQVDLGKCLMFQLTPSAARDFYRLTGTHQGRRLVLTLDGAAVGVRQIDGVIANGIIYVFVELPDASLPQLVENLKKTSIALQREISRK